jgi:hypothetical protein
MEGSCSTGQSPQRAVVPVEEQEQEQEQEEVRFIIKKSVTMHGHIKVTMHGHINLKFPLLITQLNTTMCMSG